MLFKNVGLPVTGPLISESRKGGRSAQKRQSTRASRDWDIGKIVNESQIEWLQSKRAKLPHEAVKLSNSKYI